jgi:sugar lactone lactonase YvrE
MNRRHFLSSLLFASAVSMKAAQDAPTRAAKVTKLFKSPDGHPNGLETSQEGLWIGEQITNRAHLVGWNGRLIKTVETESSNTSGIAYGGGYLWMAANGKALWRPARPTDATTGQIIQVDPATGATIARHPVPGGGGVHGLEFAEGKLWITSLKLEKLSQVDPNDFRVLRQIPVHLSRAHGLGWDPPGIWCMHSNDWVIHKLDARDGAVLEVITIPKGNPEPHGMCIHDGHLYYCDAGVEPGAKASESPGTGYVCRIDLS